MKLNEFNTEALVTIEVVKGFTKLKLESKVVKGITQGLLIECLKKDNKIIGFNTSSLVVYNAYIKDPETDRVHEWKDIKIKTVLWEGKKYHLLVSDKDSVFVNRRDSFRVFVGLTGIAQIGNHTKAVDVIVKDISESGIAIITNEDCEIQPHVTSVRVSVFDSKVGTRFDLQATVVRKERTAKGDFLYGCAFKDKNPKLSKYIAQKQLDNLQKQTLRGKSLRDANGPKR